MIKVALLIFLTFCVVCLSLAQSRKSKATSCFPHPEVLPAEEVPGIWLEELPEFPEGLSELYRFISKNLRYPAAARNAQIQGVLYAGFVIEVDGSISNPQILKGLGYGCDEEALRVIKLLPKWKPGRQNGRKVAVKYCLPFQFVLAI